MSESLIPSKPSPVYIKKDVQGMYCEIKGKGTSKCTITVSEIPLSVYSTVNLFVFDEDDVSKSFKRLTHYISSVSITRKEYEDDFRDLLHICSKVSKTEFYIAGQVVSTYAIGEPGMSEDGFLYLTPACKEWWDHPRVQPVVASIQCYFPDFQPWLLQKDKYLGILSSKSALI